MPDLFGWYTPPAASSTLGNYNWGAVALTEDPYQIKAERAALQQAGLWNPAWDAWANYQSEGDSTGTPPPMPDFGSLAGYRIGAQDFGGGSRQSDLIGPDGRVVVSTPYTYDEPSMGEQFVQGAAIVGGAALGMNAAFGGLGGAASVAPAAEAGISTLGTLPAVPGQVAGIPTLGSATGGVSGLTGGSLLTGGAIPAAAPLTFAGGAGAGVAEAGVAGLSGYGGLSGAVSAANMPTTWDTILQGLSSGTGVRSLFDVASGIYGLNLASNAREASDPFAQYRAGYGQQLQALEANPSSITSRPGWRAGLEGIDRQMAARGYYGSGNMDAARTRYAGDFYGQEVQRLAGLAGANQTPGAGQFQSANLAGNALASIGYGLAPWLSGRPA